ncbi:SAM-dependent methyltransferase [Microscilla marina]|uniref:Dimethylglycine N-methyltransferase n=1 Tax=Microscilla marina ATCC 23134 TaxID=313606 RepID=A1ZP64_MICM2|nr:class I SAM-dependent methyltransferase [Microscilla marina]EAY27856.1 dimethylglycine N-methyltransferase [Microscilla marina ATCC 23134]
MTESSNLVKATQEYYDSHEADQFYYKIWGGEDIHVGIYNLNNTSIFAASKTTVGTMGQMLDITPNTHILDIGSGYGGAARQLVRKYGCKVTCLNLSQVENERNRSKNEEEKLSHLITVQEGNFEELPFNDATFDVVWSEDAILHSGNKPQVFAEVQRVLKSGGEFIFTDPMQSDDCPEGVLDNVLARVYLEALGSVKLYRALAKENNLKEKQVIEMPEQLITHYTKVLAELNRSYESIIEASNKTYIDQMKNNLEHWIEAGKNKHLNWGILHFSKV